MTTLAPYTNAMRLGQGFNSYTQQICLDRAVVIPSQKRNSSSGELGPAPAGIFTPSTGTDPSTGPDDGLGEEGGSSRQIVRRVTEGHSQIVTYTAKFIDKLSDITESLNVSASLSIKTATVGGSVKGNYVDADKFKSSDLNFTIQVKVVNQRREAPEYSEFNSVESDTAKMKGWTAQKFTQVYGDSFISGWETGGELNALISVKMLDKSKTNMIKGELEGSLGTPALSCEVKGGVDKVSNSLNTNTETTVSVNWSGGGRIKDENVLWNINSLTLAAANFPDRVAETPQKIYAILTKYVNLYDYQSKVANSSWSPLVYENANIYTNALLDSFMDFKSIWKQIQIAMWEVENKRATVQMAHFSNAMNNNKSFFEGSTRSRALAQMVHLVSVFKLEKTKEDALVKQLKEGVGLDSPPVLTDPKIKMDATGETSKLAPNLDTIRTMDDSETKVDPAAKPLMSRRSEDPRPDDQKGSAVDESWKRFVPNLLQVAPYDPDLFGLEKARRECRLEMVKIVNEVEAVTFHPEIALDPTRDSLFMPPVVYRQMLPVVTMADNTDRRILGTSEEADFPLGAGLWLPQTKPFIQLDQTMQSERNAAKAMNFRVDGWAGQEIPDGKDVYFNNLDWLDQEKQPQVLESWYHKETHVLVGLRFTFTNGSSLPLGRVDATGEIIKVELPWAPNQQALFVNIASAPVVGSTDGKQLIDHLSLGFTSNEGGKVVSLTGDQPSKGKVSCFKTPLSRRFWDFRGLYGATNDNGFSVLGPIWCNHKNSWSPPPSLAHKICPGMDEYPEKLRLKLLDFQKDEFADYQFSKIGGSGFTTPEPSPDGFFCTLGDPHLKEGTKLTHIIVKFDPGNIWLKAFNLWNADAPDGTATGFGFDDTDKVDKLEEMIAKEEEVVGCTIFSATTGDHRQTWCIGFQLQIETQGSALSELRTRRFVSPAMDKALADRSGASMNAWGGIALHSEIMHPPREAGRWVIRGFWGEHGRLIDRLGVIWKKVPAP